MAYTSWLRARLPRFTKSSSFDCEKLHPKCRERRRPLQLEALEDRIVPSFSIYGSDLDSNHGGMPNWLHPLQAAEWEQGTGSNAYVTLTPASLLHIGSVYTDSPGYGVRSFSVDAFISLKDGSGGDGVSIGYGPLSTSSAFGAGGAYATGGVWMSIDTAYGHIYLYNNGALIQTFNINWQLLRGNFMHAFFQVASTGPSTGTLTVYYYDTNNNTYPLSSYSMPISNWNPDPSWRFGVGASCANYTDWQVLEAYYITDINTAPSISLTGGGTINDSQSGSLGWTVSDPDHISGTATLERSVHGTNNWLPVDSQTVTDNNASGSFTISGHTGLFDYRVHVTANDYHYSSTSDDNNAPTLVVSDDDIGVPHVAINGALGEHTDETVVVDPQHPLTWTQYAYQDQTFTWSVTDPSDSVSDILISKDGMATPILSAHYDHDVANSSIDLNSYGVGSYTITLKNAFDQDNDGWGADDHAGPSGASVIVNVYNAAPNAILTVITPGDQLLEGSAIAFDATSSSDPERDPIHYVWNFGDGSLSDQDKPSHVYKDNGAYSVTLTVVDSFGNISRATQTITIANVAPTVNVTAPLSVHEMTAFVMTLAIVDPGNDKASIHVNWGDGEQQDYTAGGNLSHVYGAGGQSHTIRVSLNDEDGAYTDVYVGSVDVANAAPVVTGFPTLLTARQQTTINVSVNVTDGSDDTLSYRWDFGDGDTLSGAALNHVSHAYAADGDYTLKLVVSDSDGLETTLTAPVTIGTPVSFTVADRTVAEGVGTLTLTAGFDDGLPATHDVIIPLTISGTVKAADYNLPSAQLVISAGQLTGSASLTITQDKLNENNEDLIVGMGRTVGASHGAVATQCIHIQDDDPKPSVFFLSGNRYVDESAGSVSLVVGLSVVSGRDVVVPITFSGTATADSDYRAPAAQIVIPAGALTGTLNLRIIDDDQQESAETVIATLQPSAQADLSTAEGQPTSTSFIISQNDAPTVSLDSAYRLTGEGQGTMHITARLSRFSDQTIVVPFSILDISTARRGDAAADTDTLIDAADDYTIAESAFLFYPGTAEAALTVNIVDDRLVEGTENFVVQLGESDEAIMGVTQITVTDILDNDQVRVNFDDGVTTAWEGDDVTVHVTLSNLSTKDTTIPISITGTALSGDDYTIDTTTLVVPAAVIDQNGRLVGQSEAWFNLHLTNDDHNEPTESLFLTLGEITGGVAGQVTAKSILILDDDPRVTLHTSYFGIEEGKSATFILELSAATNHDVTVPLKYSGTADAGADFTGPTSVVVLAGQTYASFTVASIDDDFVESTEHIDVSIGTPVGGVQGTPATSSITIIDNDYPPTLSWSFGSQEVIEGEATAILAIKLNAPAAVPVTITVSYADAGGGAQDGDDYESTVTSITIPAGSTSTYFEVPIIDDDVKEDVESFAVSFVSAANAYLPGNPASQRTIVTIFDNDDLSATDMFSLAEPIAQSLQQAAAGDPSSEGRGMSEVFKLHELIDKYSSEYEEHNPFNPQDPKDQARVFNWILDGLGGLFAAAGPPWCFLAIVPWTIEWMRHDYPTTPDDSEDNFTMKKLGIDGGPLSSDFKDHREAFVDSWLKFLGENAAKALVANFLSGKLGTYFGVAGNWLLQKGIDKGVEKGIDKLYDGIEWYTNYYGHKYNIPTVKEIYDSFSTTALSRVPPAAFEAS